MNGGRSEKAEGKCHKQCIHISGVLELNQLSTPHTATIDLVDGQDIVTVKWPSVYLHLENDEVVHIKHTGK